MKDFGLGKHSIEERIQNEARLFAEQLSKKTGKAFRPHYDITMTVSNIICSIAFGHR